MKVNTTFAPTVGLFEIGRVVKGVKENGLCDEHKMLCVTLMSKAESLETLYFKLRDIIAVAMDELRHSAITFKPMTASHSYQHPKNLYAIVCDGVELGEIGVVHPSVGKKIDKKAAIVYFEVDMSLVSAVKDKGIHYEEASRYPGMERDLTFLSESFAPIKEAIDKANSPLVKRVSVPVVYRDETGNAITVRIEFSHKERTLTGEEVEAVVSNVMETLKAQGIHLK